MTKFGAAENEMERLTAKFAQRTPTEQSLFFSVLMWISGPPKANFLAVRRQPYKSSCPPLKKIGLLSHFWAYLWKQNLFRMLTGCQKDRTTCQKTDWQTDRRTERQIEDKTTFQPSYQNKSCSECQQDVRKIGWQTGGQTDGQTDRQKDFSA